MDLLVFSVCSVVCLLTAVSYSAQQSSPSTSTSTTSSAPTDVTQTTSLATDAHGSFTSSRPDVSNEDEMVPPSFWSYIEDFEILPDNDPVKIFIMGFDKTFRHTVAKQLSYCPYISLCTFSLNVSYFFGEPCCPDCSCSSDCQEYDTCCLDKPLDDLNKHDSPAETCIPLYLKINPFEVRPDEISVYAVARCPINSKHITESHKCELNYNKSNLYFDNIVPVRDKQGGKIYRNMYCALCNGVDMEEIEIFEPILKCLKEPNVSYFQSESDVIEYVYSNAGCNIHFTYSGPEFNLKECVYRVSSCNLTGLWQDYDVETEAACLTHTSPIKILGITFKNTFCGMCNGHMNISRTCPFLDSIVNPFSFSRLLSFNPPEDDTEILEAKCSNNYIYDQKTTDCLPLKCSPVRILQNGQCGEAKIMIGERYFHLEKLRLKSTQSICIGEVLSVLDDIGSRLQLKLFDLFEQDESHTRICSFDYMIAVQYQTYGAENDTLYIGNDQKVDYILFNIGICFNIGHNPEAVLNDLSNVDTISVPTTFNKSTIFHVTIAADHWNSKDILYRDLKVLNNSWNCYNKSANSSELENSINPMHYSGCSKGLRNYSEPECSNILLNNFDRLLFGSCSDKNEMLFISGEKNKFPTFYFNFCCEKAIPVPFLLTCPLVVLSMNNTNYRWLIENDNVHFPHLNFTFNQSHYYLDFVKGIETLHLCKNQFLLISKESKSLELTVNAELIVSIVFCVISIVCLCLTITAFALLQQLRNLPGKNSMALACSLVLSQVLYLIGSFTLEEGSIECKVVGLLMHFALLLTIFWMNVCTFHLYRVLTRTRAIRRFSGNKRYILYHGYCIINAVIFVVITILVSTMTGDQPNFGYGDGRCYISSPEMVLYTFGIPLAFVILSNLVMFIIVIIVVKKTSSVKSSVKHERNYISIFAKLSTLTGLTWVFGFLQAWVQHPIFSYLFIVLNAGQGIFLFIALICNTRVLNMLKQRFSYILKPPLSEGPRLTVLSSSNI